MTKRPLGMCDISIDTINIFLLCIDTQDPAEEQPRRLAFRRDSLPNISTVGPHRPEPTSSDEPPGPLINYLRKQGINLSSQLLVQFPLTFTLNER